MKLGYIYMFGCLKKSTVNFRISLQLGLVEMAKCFTLPHASFDLGNRTRNNKKENERQTWVTFHGVSFCYSRKATRKKRNHLRPPPQELLGEFYTCKKLTTKSAMPLDQNMKFIFFFFFPSHINIHVMSFVFLISNTSDWIPLTI